MTPAEREAKMEAAIAALQAQGLPITKAAVYRAVGGNKPALSRCMDAWYGQHQANGAGSAAPEEEDGYAAGPACRLTDGLPEAAPPAPPPRQEPRLAALERERREAQGAVDQAQRRVQEVSRAQQEARWAARMALDRLHQASRRARGAPPQEAAAACQRVEEARAALASYVGDQAAALAEENHAYVPAGLQ